MEAVRYIAETVRRTAAGHIPFAAALQRVEPAADTLQAEIRLSPDPSLVRLDEHGAETCADPKVQELRAMAEKELQRLLDRQGAAVKAVQDNRK